MTALELFQAAARKRSPYTSHLILQPSVESELILSVIDDLLERLFALEVKSREDAA